MKQQATPRSIWQTKPWWCQPWSIALTGIALPSGTWWVAHQWWLTLPVISGVLVWWWIFLYLVPKSYARMASSSSED